jgi:hypothetical protein
MFEIINDREFSYWPYGGSMAELLNLIMWNLRMIKVTQSEFKICIESYREIGDLLKN